MYAAVSLSWDWIEKMPQFDSCALKCVTRSNYQTIQFPKRIIYFQVIVKFPAAMRGESFSLPGISCLMACPPCRETTPPNNELRNNPNDHPQWVYYRPRQHLAQAVDTPIFCLNSNFLSSCTSQRRLRIRHTSIKFTFCKVLLFS